MKERREKILELILDELVEDTGKMEIKKPLHKAMQDLINISTEAIKEGLHNKVFSEDEINFKLAIMGDEFVRALIREKSMKVQEDLLANEVKKDIEMPKVDIKIDG